MGSKGWLKRNREAGLSVWTFFIFLQKEALGEESGQKQVPNNNKGAFFYSFT